MFLKINTNVTVTLNSVVKNSELLQNSMSITDKKTGEFLSNFN